MQQASQEHQCLLLAAELGILYAKYKPEKLMEHLKLFSARINIPRLIRVCVRGLFCTLRPSLLPDLDALDSHRAR